MAVLYTWMNGRIYAAFPLEFRFNLFGEFFCIAGGVVTTEGSCCETIVHKLEEKSGILEKLARQAIKLPGVNGVWNRRYLEVDPLDSKGGGTVAFRLYIDPEILELSRESGEEKWYCFKKELLSVGERAEKVRFLPVWEMIALSPDTIGRGALAQFLLWMKQEGYLEEIYKK